MNNTFSLEQIAQTGDLNADWIMRQYKMDKKAKFMEIKTTNPTLKQYEIAEELKISCSTLKRYRREMNMLSRYRIHPQQTLTLENKKVKIILSMTSK